MLEILRKRRNRSELDKIHLAVRDQFAGLIADLEAYGHRPRLQETWRSPDEQRRKFEKGLSQVRNGGPHTNVIDLDPLGKRQGPASLATHVLDDNAPLNPGVAWVANLAVLAHKRGLQTGVAWAQSPASDLAKGKPRRILVESQIVAGDLAGLVRELTDAPKRWGFDPLHVEVVGWRRFYGVNTAGA